MITDKDISMQCPFRISDWAYFGYKEDLFFVLHNFLQSISGCAGIFVISPKPNIEPKESKMPHGDKSAYTAKQERQARHVEL